MSDVRRGQVYRLDIGDRERVVVVLSADALNASKETAIVALVLVDVPALSLPTMVVIPDGEDIRGQIRVDELWVLPARQLESDKRICTLSRHALDQLARPLMATFDLVPPPLTG